MKGDWHPTALRLIEVLPTRKHEAKLPPEQAQGRYIRAPSTGDAIARANKQRRWENRNREKVAADKRAYYLRNKARIDERHRQWCEENRERRRAQLAAAQARFQAKKKAANGA